MAPERDIHLETFCIYFGEKWNELKEKNLKIPTQSARGTCLRVEAGIIEEAKGKNWVWEGACENLEHLAIRKTWTDDKKDCTQLVVQNFLARCLSPSGFMVTPLSQPGVCESVMTLPSPTPPVISQKETIPAPWTVRDLGRAHTVNLLFLRPRWPSICP